MTTRRNILKAAPAVLVASALPAFALAATQEGEDHELRQLWSEYLDRFRAYRAIQSNYIVASEAVDAEMPPCPSGVSPGAHYREHESIRIKHGFSRLSNEINDAARAIAATVDLIRTTEASTMTGLGIKLAALATPVGFFNDFMDNDDLLEAHHATLDNIARITGRTDFTVPAVPGPLDEDET